MEKRKRHGSRAGWGAARLEVGLAQHNLTV